MYRGRAYIYGQHLEHKLAPDLCFSRHLRKALNYDIGVRAYFEDREWRLVEEKRAVEGQERIAREAHCAAGEAQGVQERWILAGGEAADVVVRTARKPGQFH